jgi:hypothetical protein
VVAAARLVQEQRHEHEGEGEQLELGWDPEPEAAAEEGRRRDQAAGAGHDSGCHPQPLPQCAQERDDHGALHDQQQ